MKTFCSVFYALSLSVTLLITGCVSSFDRAAAESRMNSVSIDKAGAVESPLKAPFKVAVFADMETMDPPGGFKETWDWDGYDRNLMVSYLEDLKKNGYVSEYVIIPDTPDIPMQDINQLFAEAARQNADVLMTIRGVIQVNSYPNPSAILNLTIIGGWLFPGSNRDVMMMTRVNLWNVKSRECALTVKEESVRKESEPTFLIDTGKIVDSVKRDTLRKTLSNLLIRCRDIKP